jgi:hypothetical protein
MIAEIRITLAMVRAMARMIIVEVRTMPESPSLTRHKATMRA